MAYSKAVGRWYLLFERRARERERERERSSLLRESKYKKNYLS